MAIDTLARLRGWGIAAAKASPAAEFVGVVNDIRVCTARFGLEGRRGVSESLEP